MQAALRPRDAVLRRVGQSGRCHRARIQHRAGDDDGDGTARRERRDRHAGADHVADQRDARVAGCGTRARDGGAVRQADDGVDLHAALANSAAPLRPDCGLFVHSDLRNVGVAMGKLAALCGSHGAAPSRPARCYACRADCCRDCRACCRNIAAKQALAAFAAAGSGGAGDTAAEAADAAPTSGLSGRAENPVARSAAQDRGRRRAAWPASQRRGARGVRRDDARRAGAQAGRAHRRRAGAAHGAEEATSWSSAW